MNRTLIENSSTELLELFQEVSDEAKKEKNHSSPLSRLMYWWTRKPHIVARAVILSSTLDNIDDVRDLLNLDKKKRSYNYLPNTSKYNTLLSNASKIHMLDPFGGAGTITFEAKCLGLNCTTYDYNPFAYMIQKAALDYPARYGEKLVDDVKHYATEVISLTEQEIGKFYSKTDLVYFWAWCIKCPHCSQRFPLSNHMHLAKTKYKNIGITLSSHNDDFILSIENPISDKNAANFTHKGKNAVCFRCHNTIDYDYMTKYISQHKDRSLLAIQNRSIKSKTYKVATPLDISNFDKAAQYLNQNLDKYARDDLFPVELIRPHHRRKNQWWFYGITTWDQFVSSRQLLVMVTFLKNIKTVTQHITNIDYRKVISAYLGFLLCKHLNQNSLGVYFDKITETPSAVTAMSSGFVYNHVELNPFSSVRGGFASSLKNLLAGIKFATRCSNTPTIKQCSVLQKSDMLYDLIITDPPYADDVQYGERSEFFYAWFYRCVRSNFKDLPNTVPLDEDFCESQGRFNSKPLAQEFYAKGLEQSFLSMRSSLKDDGLMVVFFAHSTTTAWDLLLKSIINAKFQVISAHSLHTESPHALLARDKASFKSSIIVTCRKIKHNSNAYFEDIKPKMYAKIDNLLSNIDSNVIIAMPVTDLIVMVYGKVLEVATGYTNLKSYEKDFTPNFDVLIGDARNHMMKKLLSKILGNYSASLLPTTNIYIFAKVFYDGNLPLDEFIKITKAYGITSKTFPANMLDINKKHALFFTLQKFGGTVNPANIRPHDLYAQLAHLAYLVHTDDVSAVRPFLTSSDASTFNVNEVKSLLSLLLKSYTVRKNAGLLQNSDNRTEYDILVKLAHTLVLKDIPKQITEYFNMIHSNTTRGSYND